MDWKEIEKELTIFLWGEPIEADAAKNAKQIMPFIQQLLDQRDKKIIGKLEDLKKEENSVYGGSVKSTYELIHDHSINQAISTIKENKHGK